MDMRKRWEQARPQVTRWQYQTRDRAHKSLSLTNFFGEIRWFYEVFAPDGKGGLRGGDQYEAAARFLPESQAMGATQRRLGQLGISVDYLVAMHRDWLMFEVPDH